MANLQEILDSLKPRDVPSRTYTFSSTTILDSETIREHGMLKGLTITIPSYTNNVTTQLKITDASSFSTFSSSAFARGTSWYIDLTTGSSQGIPVKPDHTLHAILSNVAGSGGGDVIVAGFVI